MSVETQEHKHTLRCKYKNASVCLRRVVQHKHKKLQTLLTVRTRTGKPCTHAHTTLVQEGVGIKFQRADYHMVYYCMPGEASVPLINAQRM